MRANNGKNIYQKPNQTSFDVTEILPFAYFGQAFKTTPACEPVVPINLDCEIRVKFLGRSVSDAKILWSLKASLPSGNGTLVDFTSLQMGVVTYTMVGATTLSCVCADNAYCTCFANYVDNQNFSIHFVHSTTVNDTFVNFLLLPSPICPSMQWVRLYAEFSWYIAFMSV